MRTPVIQPPVPCEIQEPREPAVPCQPPVPTVSGDARFDNRLSDPLRKVTRWTGTRALLVVVFAWVLTGCGSETPPPSVLLITIDTCRADRLSCYGYSKPTTPHLDQLASEGVLFQNANTTVPMTFPAHASLMTGTIPPHHGVHDNLNFRLSDDHVTLAELFSDNGYRTGAIVSAFVLDSRFHLDQGFATYDDEFGQDTKRGGMDEHNERPAGEITRLGQEWIDRHLEETRARPQPFFLFLHYFDPHADYDPPEPFAARFPDDPYAGEIAYVDQEIGKLLDHLRERGLYESTLIVVIGDHGEGLGEHGEISHDYFVYQSTIRVPLLIRPPGPPLGREVATITSIIDVAPTVLAATRVSPPEVMAGVDLSPYLSEAVPGTPPTPRYLYCESVNPTRYGCNPVLGVISDRWKFIQSSRPELFDLSEDPGELRNLIEENANRAAFLEVQLATILREQTQLGASGAATPDAETQERLQSLGYLSGRSLGGDLEFDRSRPDAKDFIEVRTLFNEAAQLVASGQNDLAREACRTLLERHPQIIDTHLLLGGLASDAEDHAEAEREYRRFLSELDRLAAEPLGASIRDQLKPSAIKAHFNLANALIDQGRRPEAVTQYRATIALDPANADAHFNLGITLAEDGQVDDALTEFLTTQRLDPGFAEARYNIGLAYLLRGRLDEGRAELEEAVRIDPSYIEPRMQLADMFASQRNLPGALAQVRAALRARPDVPEAHHRLARLLFASGDTRGGLDAYREAVRAFPQELELANELAWILSTHPDARLRDGKEASALSERLVRERPDEPALLATLAAAYAELGRFEEAVRIQESVMASVQSSGDASALQAHQQRLDQLRRGEPIRGR